MKKKRKLISKEQLICIAAGIGLGAAVMLTGESSIKRDGDEQYLERPGYGETEQSYDLEVNGSSGGSESISISVSGRMYTEEEATAVFEEMADTVMKTMLCGNASQLEIRNDLSFPESIDGYPGVRLSWSNSSGGIIGNDGTVANVDLTEEKEAVVYLTMSAGGIESSAEIPILILPAPERKEEQSWKEKVEEYLSERQEASGSSDRFVLPLEFGNETLRYSEKRDYTFLVFPFLGITAALFLGLRPKEEEKKKQKQRETELLVDYSEIVSKLIVYIGAGLTVRNAWHQLAESYRNTGGRKRAVYEEILTADRELSNGETESAAYMGFARRCNLKCYLRMVSLLEQNRKTGDSALLSALETEMSEAFEQRKNVARRLGEEAGTKLMAPLIISLITVMIIVIVPAMFQMG